MNFMYKKTVIKDWLSINCVIVILISIEHFVASCLQFLDTHVFSFYEYTYNLYTLSFFCIISIAILISLYLNKESNFFDNMIPKRVTLVGVLVLSFSYSFLRYIFESYLNSSITYNILPILIFIVFILMLIKIIKLNLTSA